MKKTILTLSAIAFLAVSCNNNPSTTSDEQSASSANTEASVDNAGTDENDGADITINAGDDMKYDLSEIRVKEGEMVTITLRHTGKLAKEAMGHNFVLLAQGTSIADFTAKAIQASTSDYIPAGDNAVLAHTKLVGGGESDTIEFTAPAKGTYDFICSFPGHAAMMNGKFIVE